MLVSLFSWIPFWQLPGPSSWFGYQTSTLSLGLEAPLLSWWQVWWLITYQIMDSIEKLGIDRICSYLILFKFGLPLYFGGCCRHKLSISINKINIHNRFKQYSADMYIESSRRDAFHVCHVWLILPVIYFMLIQFIHLKTSGPVVPSRPWRSVNLFGLVVYLVMLFVLGLAFASLMSLIRQISEPNAQVRWVYLVFIQGKKLVLISTIWCLDLVLSVPFICSLWQVLQCTVISWSIQDYLQLSMIPEDILDF